MALTLDLLRILGSPFLSEQQAIALEKRACVTVENLGHSELYGYACKNKVGLLYLEQVKRSGYLGILESEYEKQRKKYDELLHTAIHVSDVLGSSDIRHAVFKTIMPYPAVPNDVDVLFLDDEQEYGRAVQSMCKEGFEIVGASAEEIMFHDKRNCRHTSMEKKDEYDVDLYRKPAVSHLVYLSAQDIGRHVSETNVPNKGKIRTLASEADLVAIIVHAVMVEQIYALSAYYATLYHLVKLGPREIDRFVLIAEENNAMSPLAVHCAVTAGLHYAAHAFLPEKLEGILDNLYSVTWRAEIRSLARACMKMPHRYSLLTLGFAFLEKLRSGEFRNSLVNQIKDMLNLKVAKLVTTEVLWRRRRETY